MKRYETIVTTAFDASHELPACKGGHHYTVRLTHVGQPQAELGGATLDGKTLDSLILIVRELHRRRLNDMLGAAHPTVWGVAGYLLERLTIFGVQRVEVSESEGHTAAVELGRD